MKQKLLLCLILTFGLKLIYFVSSQIPFHNNNENGALTNYFDFCVKYDGAWYQSIAEKGYPKVKEKKDLGYVGKNEVVQSAWAFFPGYPMLSAGLMKVTNLPYRWVALFLCIIFSFMAVWVLYDFCLLSLRSQQKAFWITLCFFVSPFSYYFGIFYTEAIFFSFMLLGFNMLYRKNYVAFMFCLIPLVLLRPNGIVLLLPFYLFHLELSGILKGYKLKMAHLFEKQNILQSLSFVPAVLLFGGYLYYQYYKTGYPFAFSIAQVGWYKTSTFPLLSLFNRSDFGSQFNSVYTILTMAFAVYHYKKFSLSENVLIWLFILLPLSAGTTISMARYIAIIFPLFIVLYKNANLLKNKWVLVFCLLALHLFSLYPWLINHPLAY